jgi:hypothetical protein
MGASCIFNRARRSEQQLELRGGQADQSSVAAAAGTAATDVTNPWQI